MASLDVRRRVTQPKTMKAFQACNGAKTQAFPNGSDDCVFVYRRDDAYAASTSSTNNDINKQWYSPDRIVARICSLVTMALAALAAW